MLHMRKWCPQDGTCFGSRFRPWRFLDVTSFITKFLRSNADNVTIGKVPIKYALVVDKRSISASQIT